MWNRLACHLCVCKHFLARFSTRSFSLRLFRYFFDGLLPTGSIAFSNFLKLEGIRFLWWLAARLLVLKGTFWKALPLSGKVSVMNNWQTTYVCKIHRIVKSYCTQIFGKRCNFFGSCCEKSCSHGLFASTSKSMKSSNPHQSWEINLKNVFLFTNSNGYYYMTPTLPNANLDANHRLVNDANLWGIITIS